MIKETEMVKKVLVDTDIGNDIDDSLAIAYLLREPECRLMGITTVSGQPELRAMLAKKMCRDLGKPDVPIFPGIADPLLGNNRQPHTTQTDVLGAGETDVFPQNAAIDFMRKTIRENPGEISLLAIGPLTNLAVLFSVDREIPGLLKELVIMGGDFLRQNTTAEWNIVCDPVAAAMVYQTDVAIHRSIGLNVTLQVKMDGEEAKQHFSGNFPPLIREYIPIWLQKRKYIIFHDPLAAMTLFDDRICGFRKGRPEVILPPGTPNAGKIVFHEGMQNIEVADRVNADRALRTYFQAFT